MPTAPAAPPASGRNEMTTRRHDEKRQPTSIPCGRVHLVRAQLPNKYQRFRPLPATPATGRCRRSEQPRIDRKQPAVVEKAACYLNRLLTPAPREARRRQRAAVRRSDSQNVYVVSSYRRVVVERPKAASPPQAAVDSEQRPRDSHFAAAGSAPCGTCHGCSSRARRPALIIGSPSPRRRASASSATR